MTTLVLTPQGEMWDTDGLIRPRSPAALEHEAERLRRTPRPTSDDLLRLGVLETEIVGCYLTLTDRSLTLRDKEVSGLGGPPTQDELHQLVTDLDECEFLAYLHRFSNSAVIGREGDSHDCVIHRYLVYRFGVSSDAVAVRLDSVTLWGDWAEQDRTVPLPPWASRVSRLTTYRHGVFQPVRHQRIRAPWLRRALAARRGQSPPVR